MFLTESYVYCQTLTSPNITWLNQLCKSEIRHITGSDSINFSTCKQQHLTGTNLKLKANRPKRVSIFDFENLCRSYTEVPKFNFQVFYFLFSSKNFPSWSSFYCTTCSSGNGRGPFSSTIRMFQEPRVGLEPTLGFEKSGKTCVLCLRRYRILQLWVFSTQISVDKGGTRPLLMLISIDSPSPPSNIIFGFPILFLLLWGARMKIKTCWTLLYTSCRHWLDKWSFILSREQRNMLIGSSIPLSIGTFRTGFFVIPFQRRMKISTGFTFFISILISWPLISWIL